MILLNILDTDDPGTLFLIAAFALAGSVAITYFLWRWVLSIKRQLWNQQQMINILIKIAEKNGVSPDELSIIQEKNNNPNDKNL